MRRKHRYDVVLLKKRLSLLALLLAVIAIFGVINSPAIVGTSATVRTLPVYCVRRDNKCVSLTFDAASGIGATREIADLLGQYRIHATFFVTGAWAASYPASVRMLSAAGHEVMNNSNDYAYFPRLSADKIIQNVTACNDRIAALTGQVPTLFRCPYGAYDDHVVRSLRAAGLTAIQWDVDSQDWKGLSAADIARRVTSGVRPGSIVLFHTAAPHTAEALPEIIEYLLRSGYAIVPVSQLLLQGTSEVDGTGRQIPAE